jgi:hypothetical protein
LCFGTVAIAEVPAPEMWLRKNCAFLQSECPLPVKPTEVSHDGAGESKQTLQ